MLGDEAVVWFGTYNMCVGSRKLPLMVLVEVSYVWCCDGKGFACLDSVIVGPRH